MVNKLWQSVWQCKCTFGLLTCKVLFQTTLWPAQEKWQVVAGIEALGQSEMVSRKPMTAFDYCHSDDR